MKNHQFAADQKTVTRLSNSKKNCTRQSELAPRRVPAAAKVLLALFITTILLSNASLAQQTSGCSNTGQGADTNAPCFANVGDILSGRTSMLKDDDLVVNSVTPSAVARGANLLTTDSAITSTSATNLTSNSQLTSNQVLTLRGRMFNLDHDQVLSAASIQTAAGPSGVATFEGKDASIPLPSLSILPVNLPPNQNSEQSLYGASGDFLGTGYDSMVIVGQRVNTGNVFMQWVGAVAPADPSQGASVGPLSGQLATLPFGTVAVTAGVFSDPSPTSPRPAAQLAMLSEVDAQTLQLQLFFVPHQIPLSEYPDNLIPQPREGAITIWQPPLPPGVTLNGSIGIAAGRFGGGTHDQIAVVYGTTQNVNVYVTIFDFDAQGKPVKQTTTNTGQTSSANPVLYVAKGRFNWFGNSDQLAISDQTMNEGTNVSWIGVMSFDTALTGTMGTPYIPTPVPCDSGLAAGRFDNMTQSGQINTNLQLADVSTACIGDNNTVSVNIYNVIQDPNNPAEFAVQSTLASQYDVTSLIGRPDVQGGNTLSLIAADEQGRSLALGPPEKVTVLSHYQPEMVLEVPPMQVDWIAPLSGVPQIVNFSVYPSNMYATYTFGETSGSTISSTGTTSYSFATKQTTSESLSYGSPGVGNISVNAQQAASQLHSNSVSKQYNTYSGAVIGDSTQTVFDDAVASSSNDLAVYTYPVIGQCYNTTGTCNPMYVQFSGPDTITYSAATSGANLEWYQPVHEPGNIFSYPATLSQLENNLPVGISLDTVTGTPQIWDPQVDQSNLIKWNNQGGSGATAGATNTHSFDTSFSVTAGVSFQGFGATAGLSLDYNQSSSLSSLNTTTSKYDSSTGINVQTGTPTGLFSDDYSGQTVIYGLNNPNVVQDDAAPATTVTSTGYLTVAHLADMVSPTSASYWRQAYTAATDIALNHPQRWNEKVSPSNGQQVVFNCPFGYTAAFDTPPAPCSTVLVNPSDGLQAFSDIPSYKMKGLFITPGNTGNGPQITSTTVGSTVSLKVRVYNYSLLNFPAGSTLHVQFYAQPFDGGNGTFLGGTAPDAFAPALFIGDGTTQTGSSTLPLPPAFCGGTGNDANDPCATTGTDTSNWEYVYANWNTTGVAANTTYEFWVLTWVTDSAGALVTELPGHGLTSAPPMNPETPYNSMADVPTEIYSNNLGIYAQPFMVLPSTTGVQTTVGAEAKTGSEMRQLMLGKSKKRNRGPVRRNVPVTILTPHTVSGDHVDSIVTSYYDGDPAKPGSLFDIQRITRVYGGSSYMDTAQFQPRSCGEHKIFVHAVAMDRSGSTATSKTTFRVTDDPVASLNDLIKYVNRLEYPQRYRRAMLLYLVAALRSFDTNQTRRGTIQVKVLLKLVKDGVFCVPTDVQHVLEAQLNDLIGCL